MKSAVLIVLLVISTLAIPSTASALDPSVFLNVLNIDIKNNRRDFKQVKDKLGPATQINTGDAASYEGRVEYILRSRSEMLTFFDTECTDGYRVRKLKPSEKSGKFILKPNVQRVEAGGLYLGMNTDEVEKIFKGTPSGGWSIEKSEKTHKVHQLIYRKTIEVTNHRDQGDNYRAERYFFCDRIWITLKFDSQRKLGEYDIEAGGCDDQACEGDLKFPACVQELSDIQCFQDNFKSVYHVDKELFWKHWRHHEAKANACTSKQATAQFISFATKCDGEAAEAMYRFLEKLIIENAPCFLASAETLDDDTMNHLVYYFILTPLYHEPSETLPLIEAELKKNNYQRFNALYFNVKIGKD